MSTSSSNKKSVNEVRGFVCVVLTLCIRWEALLHCAGPPNQPKKLCLLLLADTELTDSERKREGMSLERRQSSMAMNIHKALDEYPEELRGMLMMDGGLDLEDV